MRGSAISKVLYAGLALMGASVSVASTAAVSSRSVSTGGRGDLAYLPYASAPRASNGGRPKAGNRAHQRAAQKKRNQARHRKAMRG